MARSQEIKTVQDKFLQKCDITFEEFKIKPFTLVIFGGAGDLSKRMILPSLFHILFENELPDEYRIVGFGLPELTDDAYRDIVHEALKQFSTQPVTDKLWKKFSSHLHYISSTFDQDKNYELLKEYLEKEAPLNTQGEKSVICYLAVPPSCTPMIIPRLHSHGISRNIFKTKVILEKPFGTSLETAKELNTTVHKAFDEDQVYRIDHYLGKETVQNILFFRFSNSIYEPLWNRRYIDNVQITVAESIGIEHRGAFYEQAGVVRDIVQNHIMQIIGLIAMEPPVGFSADHIRDEKIKVFKSIRPISEDNVEQLSVRGQYGEGHVDGKKLPGYRQEKNVSPSSNTPTFFAAKLFIDNWRWAGVPFYVRAAKRMPKRVTQIDIQFKQPPLKLFGSTCDVLEPNVLTIGIQPEERISLHFGVKYPHTSNQIFPVDMSFSYKDVAEYQFHPAYEQLLVDCMKGDLTLFVRQDGIEAMWAVVDQILVQWEKKRAANFPNYAAGTWGPPEAARLLEKDGKKWLLK